MPIYQYKAFTAAGKSISGHIDATNIQYARSQLKKKKLYIKELKEDTGKRDRQLFPFLSKLLYRVPRKEIGLFARQLGTLLGAGISIDAALKDLEEQITNKHLQKVVTEIRASVIEGKSLSETFAQHRDIFPQIYESMVKVGESTGSYEKTLTQLAEVEEKTHSIKQKAITALIYPIIMIVIMLVVVFILLTGVIPQIQIMYDNFGKGMELPLPTRIVIGASDCVRVTWPYIIGGFMLSSFFFARYRKTSRGKLKTDAIFLKLPIYGKLIRKSEVARFARNLAVLLDAGVSILTAMAIVKDSASNEIFRREIDRAKKRLEEGETLKQSLGDSTFIPHLVKGVINAGEASDRLPELVEKGAEMLEDEVESTAAGLTTAMEPILIVFLALVIGGIMASVLIPMYKMMELIK